MSPDGFSVHTTLDGHGATITAMEFSPDGRFLASAGDDGVVLIFSTLSWTPECRFVDVSPVSVLRWHRKKDKLLFCGHRNGDLHVLTMSESMKLTVVQISSFGGCVYSLSLSQTSPRVAIAYGNEVAITDLIPNPYRLKDDREYLPKPSTISYDHLKLGGPIVKSLQFIRDNHLVVTYASHGILVWDLHTMSVFGEIVPRTFPIGNSVIATDNNIMAVSNLINGIDWYSLSDLVFLSTTKLPPGIVFHSSSGLTYCEDGAAVVLGGVDGSAYVLGRDRGVKRLEHHGSSTVIQSVAFTHNARGRPLIATGTGGLHGEVKVTIWTYAIAREKSGILSATIQRIMPVGLTWNQIWIHAALFCLCWAWLVHFLAGRGANNTQGELS